MERSRYNLTRRIAAGVAIGLAALAVGRILTPREPALVAGLDGDWDARNSELSRRVAQAIPPGSSAAAARRMLLDQGFTVSQGQAKWDRDDYPCRTFVTIRWEAAGERIRTTGASIFQACR